MADEATATDPVDAQPPTAAVEPTEPIPTNGETAATEEMEDQSETVQEHTKLDESVVDRDDADAADPTESASAEQNGDASATPGSKDKKRKSTGGVPEHKNKKLNKKKSMPTLHLDCKPGEFYWARLKGYPPWPSIICDEEMLPETLLATRPVSTARPDGSLREDFKEGGKNAKERTFPIMFLHTNEFQWMINTALTPLDPEECLTMPKTKMTKALQGAYKVASEGHDMEYFKKLLRQFQEEEQAYQQENERLIAEQERLAAEAEERAAAAPTEAQSAEKSKKKARKSKGGDEDVTIEDADAPKSTKKRKKDVESEGDAPKTKKTPKITKIAGPKAPNGEASATKKSASKPKKKVVSAPKEDEEEKPQMTEEERLAQREKAVLYLRHRLQKGFLSRDQAPKEEEMAAMADFFNQLENYDSLEASIIRTTKIHKVLKAIVKLASVPKDNEFSFKKRSSALLEIWNKRMESDGDGSTQPVPAKDEKDKPAETNGNTGISQPAAAGTSKKEAEQGEAKPAEGQEIEMQDAEASEKPADNATEEKADENADQIENKIEDKIGEKIEEKLEAAKPAAVSEPADALVEKSADLGNDAKDEADGDVTMTAA